MVMKKAVVVSMLAAVVSASVVSAVSAAPVKPAAVVQVKQSSFDVNGSAITVRSIVQNGETLVAVGDIIKALGAEATTVSGGLTTITLDGHAVELKVGSKQIKVDGAASNLNQPLVNINGSNYIAVRPLVSGLGGTLVWENGSIAINTVKLLEGAENPRFAGAGKLIVSKTDENGRTDYLVDTTTGKYDELLNTVDGSDLVVAPNGLKAAYTTTDGAVYVLDLATKTSTKVSSDDSIKPELVWSSDSSMIYFLQGDKGSVIASLNPADGTITKLLEDKVDYKENLSVSADGKKFVYTVTTLGTVTSDTTNVDADNVDIDYSANQEQIFSYDSTAEKAAPVKLTKSPDDKVFVESADGVKAYYVSVGDDGSSDLVSVDSTQVNPVLTGSDIQWSVLDNGKLYVLAAKDSNNNVIYSIDTATGEQTTLYTVSSDVTSLVVSGSQVAIVKNDQVFVNNGQAWKAVTK
jgi:hypothetical protein